MFGSSCDCCSTHFNVECTTRDSVRNMNMNPSDNQTKLTFSWVDVCPRHFTVSSLVLWKGPIVSLMCCTRFKSLCGGEMYYTLHCKCFSATLLVGYSSGPPSAHWYPRSMACGICFCTLNICSGGVVACFLFDQISQVFHLMNVSCDFPKQSVSPPKI